MRELRSDVLVVGGGPAGMAAAVAAADSGAAVVRVLDDNPAPGGQIWRRDVRGGRSPAAAWTARLEHAGVPVHTGTTLVDAASATDLFAFDAEGPLRLRADAVVLATGARELLLPFPGWTLPGVVGAGAMQALVKGGLDVRGARVVVAGSGPLLLPVASLLRQRGARVLAIAEQAPIAEAASFAVELLAHPAKAVQAAGLLARLLGVRKRWSAWPVRAEGGEQLHRVTLRTERGELAIECDWLACGFGVVPGCEVALLLGCALHDDGVEVDELQATRVQGVFAAGLSRRWGSVQLAVAEGTVAGHAAAGDERSARAAGRRRDREQRFTEALDRSFALRPELRALADADDVLCRCEDVTLGEVREFRDARDAKLKTRCGMGPCQGRVCGAAARFLFGWQHDRVRPPLVPIPLGALEAIGATLNAAGDSTP